MGCFFFIGSADDGMLHGKSYFIGSAGRVLVKPDGNREYRSLEMMGTPSHNKKGSKGF